MNDLLNPIGPRKVSDKETMLAAEIIALETIIKSLQVQIAKLEIDGGAAAYMLEWMIAEKYRKPYVPVLVEGFRHAYKRSLTRDKKQQQRIAELEAENAELKNPWINITDRLPDGGQEYLTYTKNGFEYRKWRTGDGINIARIIGMTKWMPIPKEVNDE